MMEKYGSPAQQAEWIPKMLGGTARIGFGLTEPLHGSGRHVDGDHSDPRRRRVGDQRREVLEHRAAPRNARLHLRPHLGSPGDGLGITCFIVPTDSPGFEIEEFMWTFNMPTDHAHVKLNEVRVHNDTILGDEGLGLMTAQLFVHENRIRQAASSLGAGLHCIDTAVAYANQRTVFGKTLSTNQAIQFPLAELATEAEMLRALIWKTAWQTRQRRRSSWRSPTRLPCATTAPTGSACDAADQAMQTCGGMGTTGRMPVRAHLPAPPSLPDHRRVRRDPDPQSRRQVVRHHRPRQGIARAIHSF